MKSLERTLRPGEIMGRKSGVRFGRILSAFFYPKYFPFISLEVFLFFCFCLVEDNWHVCIVWVYYFVEWKSEETKGIV